MCTRRRNFRGWKVCHLILLDDHASHAWLPESTALSCSLADQGIKIRIRKDIRQRKPRSGLSSFPIPNGQPLGPGVPIQDEESDRESEVRQEDHNDTTNNHNSLSNITSK